MIKALIFKMFFFDTTEKSPEKLSELDSVDYEYILSNLRSDDYIPGPGETKSGRYEHN